MAKKSKRLVAFINRDVSEAFGKYLQDAYGPGRKPTSSLVQAMIVDLLTRHGYWPNGKKPA